MEQLFDQAQHWLTQLGATAPIMPYLVIVGVLLLTGFGLPFPEDVPIIAGAYLAAIGYAEPGMMFAAIFIAIMGSDAIVFLLGRRYGHHVTRMPLLRRYLSKKRLAKTEAMLHQHGGKFMFMARFLPGLRTPAIFTAGSFKVPYWRFLLFDGSAALLSVPTIFFLAYLFAHQLDRVREWVANGQVTAAIVILILLGLVLGFKWFARRRWARSGG